MNFKHILLLLLLSVACHGQAKLKKAQGSHAANNVHCGVQDQAGNLWFGTTGDGVFRYDGKTFANFTTKNGLSSNTVWSILADKTGNIWIGTNEGLCRFDGKNMIAVPLMLNFMATINQADEPSYGANKNAVWSMLEDKTGKIWIGTGGGVYVYNGKAFTHFLQNDGVINKEALHLKMVDCILEDKVGNIWFASGMPPGMEGLCRYDGRTISSSKPNGDTWIRYIIEDKKGHLWFGGRNHGNFIYNGQTFSKFTEKTGIGNCILVDKLGNIWFTGSEGDNNYESKDGIWRYDGKTFKNYGTKEGMGKDFVHSMIEDKSGNIWIGTRNTGLYRFDGKNFMKFSE